jgi:hypothetical protein
MIDDINEEAEYMLLQYFFLLALSGGSMKLHSSQWSCKSSGDFSAADPQVSFLVTASFPLRSRVHVRSLEGDTLQIIC